MGKLDGKVAVITSGSTGIGRGIGEAFLAEGASIVINGRDPEKGARALKEINAGDRGHFIRGDVTVKWNLYSAFWASRKALEYMIPQQSGRIINISSVEGKHGKPAIPAYVTCKHALIGLTKAIARENGTSGITCNAICPGLVWTDVLVATGPDSAREMGLTFDQMVDQFAQETALKRISTIEEVAAVAVLLASDVAGGITGSAYNVDGGTAAY
jgi:3-hydroxybutyrate dehydrogenase